MANGLGPDTHPFSPERDIPDFAELTEARQHQITLLSNSHYFLGLARESDFFESLIKPDTKDLNPIYSPDIVGGGLEKNCFPSPMIDVIKRRISGPEAFYDPTNIVNYREKLDLIYARVDLDNLSPEDSKQISLLKEQLADEIRPKIITGPLSPTKERRLTTHQAVSHLLQHTGNFPNVMKGIESSIQADGTFNLSRKQAYGLRLIWLAFGRYDLQNVSNPYALTYMNPEASHRIYQISDENGKHSQAENPEILRQRHADKIILDRLTNSGCIEALRNWHCMPQEP